MVRSFSFGASTSTPLFAKSILILRLPVFSDMENFHDFFSIPFLSQSTTSNGISFCSKE